MRLSGGPQSADGLGRRAVVRRGWGRVDADPLPYGVTRYRLVVYPPDIGAGALLRVRAWRAWPAVGVLVSAATALVAPSLVGAALGISTALLLYLAGFVVLAVVAFPERRLVRQVWAEDPGEAAALDDVLSEARVRLLGEVLCAADDARACGELSACEYRDVWRYVYDEVGALLAPAPTRVAD